MNNNHPSFILQNIIKIQKWYRGNIVRLKRLPIIIYLIQKYLQSIIINISVDNEDGRINSSIDENTIINLLIDKYNVKIKKAKMRMWYDLLIFDTFYGWLPVNIKSTTTKTCDNTGNLAMCVYAYTDEILDIHKNTTYENGKMSKLLFEKLRQNKYNKNNKKDYYFIIINKNDKTDIIVNSVKGLILLTPNINNLPFQVCWNKNRNFHYENIHIKIQKFIDCLKKPNPSWKEEFMMNMRNL